MSKVITSSFFSHQQSECVRTDDISGNTSRNIRDFIRINIQAIGDAFSDFSTIPSFAHERVEAFTRTKLEEKSSILFKF